jgi:hypothetical protein
LRRFLIFDCCFAAQAYQEFQSPGPAEAARVKTLEDFPKKGTALLCASSAQDVALAPRGEQYTMFSGALLEVLRAGDPTLESNLTLEQLGERVRVAIREKYPDEAVRPEVKSPDEREGDVAKIPLFPNPALRPRQIDERVKAVERALDAVLRRLSEVDKSLGLLSSVQRKIAESQPQQAENGKDAQALRAVQDESQNKGWIRETLPGRVQLALRLYRQARWTGVAWVGCALILCLPQLYSILIHPIPIIGSPSRFNPWCWLVIFFALCAGWVVLAPFLRRRLGNPKEIGYEPWWDIERGPWETLPEVVAMTSTRTFPALGTLRIASPFFEIGTGAYMVTALLVILAIIMRSPVLR